MVPKTEGLGTEVRVAGDGTAVIPAMVLKALGIEPGTRIRVRVTTRALNRELVSRGVTEEEVELISSLQLEPRENVERFLATEGAFRRALKWSAGR